MILIGVMNVGDESRVRALSPYAADDDRLMSRAGGLARALLRRIALESGHFPEAASWAFSRAPSGQPRLASCASTDISISLSHSGNWVACAISTAGPVGVDIEAPRPGRSLHDIAALSFGPAEQLRSRNNPEEFYRIWTIREAIAKAAGIGFSKVVDRQDYADQGPMHGHWRSTAAGETWDITCLQPAPGLSLACAVFPDAASPPETPVLYQFNESADQ